MLGERSPWVHNVRAAGGRAVIRHGRRHEVRLIEVPPDERAPVIKAYLERAVGARPISRLTTKPSTPSRRSRLHTPFSASRVRRGASGQAQHLVDGTAPRWLTLTR